MFRQKVLFETQGILLNRAIKPGIVRIVCNSSTIAKKCSAHPNFQPTVFIIISLCFCCIVVATLKNLDLVPDYLIAVSPNVIVFLVSGEAGFGGQAAHHLPHQQQGAPGANIDLGAVYQNTVENRVTRTFSQHWIIVGKHLRFGFTTFQLSISFDFLLRVLLLDFDGKFTLLIPNIELGKAFRINKADVEVTFDKLLS